MSADIAIRADRVSKQYKLGKRENYKSVRDSFANYVAMFVGRLASKRNAETREDPLFWAVKDISFELRKGEVLGVIGSNGAGKSTLLKILSRITEPTEGCVEIEGRIGSLLEVGAGFHPELTGRENIYLNGAILGMKRNEIHSKFDAIVAFSEVDRFLDTPVKHYSSGMYVRLAFAVAAHLEPDVLLVDEVLAVGDAAFQKKCLGKIEEVSGGGRTVLLVSHNMGAIKSLATTVMWLEHGRLKSMGDPKELVNQYLSITECDSSAGFYDAREIEKRRVHHEKYLRKLELHTVTLRNDSGRTSGLHFEGAEILLDLEILSTGELEALEIFVRVKTLDGQLIFTCMPEKKYTKIFPGRYRATIRFSTTPLLPGLYQGDVVLLSNTPQDNVSPAFRFEIAPDPECSGDERTVLLPGASAQVESSHRALGLIRIRASLEEFTRTTEQ